MTLPLFPPKKPAIQPHHCHARLCDELVPPELLMCLRHWRTVPRPIQRAVWRAYRVGQCDDKRPSEAWFLAADAAIGYVAMIEGLPLLVSELSALKEFGYLPKEAR